MPSKISWTDETWNPIVGCTKCSPGCEHCYAERMAVRLAGIDKETTKAYKRAIVRGKWSSTVALRPNQLDKPLHWRKPRRIFVCSMSDLFHPKVPFEFIFKVLRVIEKCPQHTFQLLTKRPKVAYDLFGGTSGAGLSAPPLPNLHLGVSISTQAEADEKIPILLQIPAAVRWVSIEPMLEGIDLAGTHKDRMGKTGYLADYFRPFYCNHCGRQHSRPGTVTMPCGYCGGRDGFRRERPLHWVVYGCESGPGRKPLELKWVRDGVRQCKAAGVACFVKQLPINGKVSRNPEEWPPDLRVQDYPNG